MNTYVARATLFGGSLYSLGLRSEKVCCRPRFIDVTRVISESCYFFYSSIFPSSIMATRRVIRVSVLQPTSETPATKNPVEATSFLILVTFLIGSSHSSAGSHRVSDAILTLLTHRRIVAITGEPNRFTADAVRKWLRVPLRSAEDPSNLLQVMLAKGYLFFPSSYPPSGINDF